MNNPLLGLSEYIDFGHELGLHVIATANTDTMAQLTAKGRTLVRKMARPVQRAHDRTIDKLHPSARDSFLLKLIELVEANNEVGSVPLRLP